MPEKEQVVLLCYRIEDMPIPHTRAYAVKCDDCGKPIWLSYSNPAADKRVCMQCAAKMKDLKVAAPTPAQLADAATVLRGKKQ